MEYNYYQLGAQNAGGEQIQEEREWYARRQKETTFSKAVFLKLSDNWWKKSLMELHFGKIVVWKLLCLLYLKMILLQITFLANWNFLISNKLIAWLKYKYS